MDCNVILTLLEQVRKETERVKRALSNGDSNECDVALSVIELHIQAIRAEVHDRKNYRAPT